MTNKNNIHIKRPLVEIKDFGRELIETRDLDPVYVAIWEARLPADQVHRLLVAYLMFYHLGSAAQLSEFDGKDFWRMVKLAAQNKPNDDGSRPWPRGAERRHFRGQKCVDAVEAIRDRWGSAEAIIEALTAPVRRSNTLPLAIVMERVQELPMFGPWVAFKAADLCERLLDVPIEFPPDLTLFYDEPRAALDLFDGDPETNSKMLLRFFSKWKAPPRYERECNVAELETVCCKFKSSCNGHYWVGHDIREVRHGLKGWGSTADRLFKSCPAELAMAGDLFANLEDVMS